MKEILIKHIVEILFSLITGALAYKLQQLKSIIPSIKALLRDRFTQGAYHFIQKGSINKDELENLTDLHEQYHKLGGNSYTDLLFDKIKELPIEEDAQC